MYNIPVVLFIFRRIDTMSRIIDRIREVGPKRIYILADGGRTVKEQEEAVKCRDYVEKLIDWDCEIIKNYSNINRGVYKNIGEGAKWVFQREEKAVFIEDDNLPELSFFHFAEELLEHYKNDDNVAWICGTNYYTEMESNYSYHFTQHLLPCGWASWGHKFPKIYDGLFENYSKPEYRRNFKKSYDNKLLWLYQNQLIKNEIYRFKRKGKFSSWDYQMLWSVRSQNMFGIVPMRNQITNIGVDEFSIHGGVSNANVMTRRFCGVESKEIEFPLKHPDKIEVNSKSDKMLGDVIQPPVKRLLMRVYGSKLKHLLGKDSSMSWKSILLLKH